MKRYTFSTTFCWKGNTFQAKGVTFGGKGNTFHAKGAPFAAKGNTFHAKGDTFWAAAKCTRHGDASIHLFRQKVYPFE